ncbi:DNA repair protein [Frankia sp. R43]|nr:DNA repair protein [Frankia sp. R43]
MFGIVGRVRAAPFQASLLDVLPDGQADAVVEPLREGLRRHELAAGAWVDLRRRWVTGADSLFERLCAQVPWRAERRPMYDRTVDIPRLLSFYEEGQPLPDPALMAARRALDLHYAPELGEPFATLGLALYRDGRDSVAWHGDRIGRGSSHDTMVAILVLGAPRALLLRPRPGGPAATSTATATATSTSTTIRLTLGHGDLLVMGGSCQRTWDHAVPKTTRPIGPRLSAQFRPRNVR